MGVDSELGKGLSFWFEITFGLARSPASEPLPEPLPKLHNVNLLICIPDPDERQALSRYFQHNNLRHVFADTVGNLLERCAMHDVVLIDDWPGSGGSSDELASAIIGETSALKTPGIVKLKNQPNTISKPKQKPGVPLQRPYSERPLLEAVPQVAQHTRHVGTCLGLDAKLFEQLEDPALDRVGRAQAGMQRGV